MDWQIPSSWKNQDAKSVGQKRHVFAAVAVITFVMKNMAVSVQIYTVNKSIIPHMDYEPDDANTDNMSADDVDNDNDTNADRDVDDGINE